MIFLQILCAYALLPGHVEAQQQSAFRPTEGPRLVKNCCEARSRSTTGISGLYGAVGDLESIYLSEK